MDWKGQVYRKSEYDQNYWARIREAVIERDGYRCKACGRHKPRTKLTAHHIIPRSEGGLDDMDNLIALCHSCHDHIEETNLRSYNEIYNCFYGMDWEKEQRLDMQAHDRMMEKIDAERPDWHALVYGCRRRKHK